MAYNYYMIIYYFLGRPFSLKSTINNGNNETKTYNYIGGSNVQNSITMLSTTDSFYEEK